MQRQKQDSHATLHAVGCAIDRLLHLVYAAAAGAFWDCSHRRQKDR